VQDPGVTIVTIAPRPAPGLNLADVIVGSLSLTVIAVLFAAVFGVVLSYILIRWNRRHPPEQDHLPSVNPLIARATETPKLR
jgi:hypothetical protein